MAALFHYYNKDIYEIFDYKSLRVIFKNKHNTNTTNIGDGVSIFINY